MRDLIDIIESAQQSGTIWFHGSLHRISKFYSKSHFGTRSAAIARSRYKAKHHKATSYFLHEVELDIRKPFRASDEDASDEATMLRSMIQGQYPDHEFDLSYARENGAYAELARQGYDGIIYSNIVEDEGKDSIVTFRTSQIRILSVTEIPVKGGR